MALGTGVGWCDTIIAGGEHGRQLANGTIVPPRTQLVVPGATFNHAWGCSSAGPECAECYARLFAKRYGWDLWDESLERRVLSDAYWAEPLGWNEQARVMGVPWRVFCASMGDVGEDHPVVLAQLPRLWRLIEATPHLIWMLLTKRPENMAGRVPASWISTGWPKNVWLGTSSGTQVYARLRVPLLMAIPGVHTLFVSVEPQLAPVDLTYVEPLSRRRVDALLKLTHPHEDDRRQACDAYGAAWTSGRASTQPLRDGRRWWIIGGGESGSRARRCETAWLASLVEQGRSEQTPIFIKQLGSQLGRRYRLPGKGEDWAHWPDELASLRVREWPDGSKLDVHEPVIILEKKRRRTGETNPPSDIVGQIALPD